MTFYSRLLNILGLEPEISSDSVRVYMNIHNKNRIFVDINGSYSWFRFSSNCSDVIKNLRKKLGTKIQSFIVKPDDEYSITEIFIIVDNITSVQQMLSILRKHSI